MSNKIVFEEMITFFESTKTSYNVAGGGLVIQIIWIKSKET